MSTASKSNFARVQKERRGRGLCNRRAGSAHRAKTAIPQVTRLRAAGGRAENLDPVALLLHSKMTLREASPEETQISPSHTNARKRTLLCSKSVRYLTIQTDRPYACTTCGQAFSQSSDLTVHMRAHSGERPYTCTSCSKAFSKSSDLTRHRKNVHALDHE